MEEVIQKKQTLKEMLVEQALLLEDILDSVMNDEQERQLIRLEAHLPWKVDGWISVLKKDGALDYQKEKLKEKTLEIAELIDAIDDEKKKKLFYLHDIMTEMGLDRLDGNDFYMKKDVSYKTMVNMEAVEDKHKRWILPELKDDEFQLLLDILKDAIRELVVDDLSRANSLLSKLENNLNFKCGVKDLPEEHPALVREVTPTVRFYKRSMRDRKAS
ncbi:MAG: hypothetical protein Q8940_07255 [Bacteroidota bacterium]|nr:hypothetical protein [Bacteroidota bacterium]